MQTRKLLFYFFIFLFVIIAPVLTAFSLGYTFNTKTTTVEKTGGIFVKSKVPRLSIFLDGAFQKETALLSGGALLTELAPRTYLLRIEKEGYQPWFKTVAIQESLVNEFRNIVLVPHTEFTSRATTTKEEITRLSPPPPAKLYSLDKKNNVVDVKSVVIAGNIRTFFSINDTLYLIDRNGFLARRASTSKTLDILGRPGFYLANNPFTFAASPQNDLLIIDPSGGLFFLSANDRSLHVIGGGVKYARFDKNGEKMLAVKENEILLHWIKDNTYQPFQKAGSEETIFNRDAPILDAVWFFETNAHIAIRTAEGIFLTEIDGRGGRNTSEVVSGKTDELFTSPSLPNAIFYRKNKTWFRIEL
ncbi:MAG: hypothetical protein HYT37_01790 [Candidatus Sungbacteria bacterium]|nr:hypothetical protein [Candidatus Sungbacteria bacterium]